jgi:hypothetical protein
MAAKKYYVDIDLNQNEIIDAVLQNVTEAGVANPIAGQIIFDTGTSTLKYYDGGNWQSAETRLDGALQYKGTIAHDHAAITDAQIGDLYAFSSGGTATYFGGVVVEAGDFVIFRTDTPSDTWDVIQKNTVYATTTDAGVVELSTDAETITGTDATRAITPANLTAWAGQTDKTVVRKKVVTGHTITTSGNSISHSLGSDPQVTVYDNAGDEIEVLVTKGVNSVTLQVNATNRTNCTVVISA